MRLLLITILFILTTQYAIAQQCNTGCTYNVTGNNSTANNINPNNNETICITGNATLGNMNINGSNITICVKTGITASYANNLANGMTINVYGTFTFSGNINGTITNFTFNVYNGGTLNVSNGISNVTVNNNTGGKVNFTSTSSSSGLKISNSGIFTYAGSGLSNSTITNTGTFTASSGTGSLSNSGITNSGTFTYAGSGGISTGTISNSGTFNQTGSGNLSGITLNNTSTGIYNYSGTELNSGTNITNAGTVTLKNTGTVTFQSNATITNNTGGTFTATAPSKVMVNQGAFTNSGIATFTNLENQEGNFTNNSGATLTFQQGTFQHGGLHNYGAMIVNCSGGFASDCSNPCVRMGNKNSGQFSNDGSFTIHGSLCVGAGVIFHNNGTTVVDNNMNLENSNSQWVQGANGSTSVGGTTTNPSGGTFTGGTLCSNTINGTVNSTISCGGTPPTINNITATTCKNIAVSINVPATAASGTTITWSSLKIINGTDTVLATVTNPTLTTSAGTYKIYYNSTSASVLYTPASGYTGSKAISYRIASLSGSTTTYADAKTLTTTVNVPLNKPTLLISNP